MPLGNTVASPRIQAPVSTRSDVRRMSDPFEVRSRSASSMQCRRDSCSRSQAIRSNCNRQRESALGSPTSRIHRCRGGGSRGGSFREAESQTQSACGGASASRIGSRSQTSRTRRPGAQKDSTKRRIASASPSDDGGAIGGGSAMRRRAGPTTQSRRRGRVRPTRRRPSKVRTLWCKSLHRRSERGTRPQTRRGIRSIRRDKPQIRSSRIDGVVACRS